MILCRIYTGEVGKDKDGKPQWTAPFAKQGGEHRIIWVVDELALKALDGYDPMAQTGAGGAVAEKSYRPQQGYGMAHYYDKVLKPVHLKQSFGVDVSFPEMSATADEGELKQMQDLSEFWMVLVEVPPNSMSIPLPAWGMLVPRPYDVAGGKKFRAAFETTWFDS